MALLPAVYFVASQRFPVRGTITAERTIHTVLVKVLNYWEKVSTERFRFRILFATRCLDPTVITPIDIGTLNGVHFSEILVEDIILGYRI